MYTELFEIALGLKVAQIGWKLVFRQYDITENDIKYIGGLLIMRLYNDYAAYNNQKYYKNLTKEVIDQMIKYKNK